MTEPLSHSQRLTRILATIESLEERLQLLQQLTRRNQKELALEALDRALIKLRAEKRLLRVELETPLQGPQP